MKTIRQSLTEIVNFDFVNASQKEIEDILPTFGMNNEYISEIPPMFSKYMGWGIKFWQYPNQLSKLLCHLKGKKINSYLEIGVRYGGTFVLINELLKRYNNYVESHCVDIIPPSEILHTYQHEFVRDRFYYHQTPSHSSTFFDTLTGVDQMPIGRTTKKIDLVFIDGCHTYPCVKHDYVTALILGAKYIIFHDISNRNSESTRLIWNEVKKNHKKTYEFIDQYEGMDANYLGIGFVEVSPEDAVFPMFESNYPGVTLSE
jgi:hypothetical protein